MAPPTRTFKHLLLWLFTGTRGGPNRARIIKVLQETPMNTNKLRLHLNIDYRTVKHHLKVLEDNELIYEMGSGYGSMFFLSKKMEENIQEFEEIWGNIRKHKEEDEK